MAAAIKNSKIIISRSGYSSIMDLISLDKTGIIIPTSGQTEQEYLANYLHKKELFIKAEQNSKSIENAIIEFETKKNTLEHNIKNIPKNSELVKLLKNRLCQKDK